MSICTDAFVVPAQAMARVYGFPGYEFATVPHPIASLDPDQIRGLVAVVVPAVLRLLGAES